MSNGEPPPESLFDFCVFVVCALVALVELCGFAVACAGGCVMNVLATLVSTDIPPVLAAVLVAVLVAVAAVVAARLDFSVVLVCCALLFAVELDACVLVELLCNVVKTTFGHRY